MPANLTPEYKAAEAAFRKARDPRERLEWLREMLRTMPKHKGTDHLQGDIKRRIKELSEELERPQRGGARGGPAVVIRPEGAAQIALIGPPNAGKSSLHARLTGSAAPAAPYPFTTQYPEPGMMPHENISLQLVDLPAVSPEHPVPWLASTLQTADAALLVVDLCDPACLEQVETVRTILRERRVTLTDRWEPVGESSGAAAEGDGNPSHYGFLSRLVANKVECLADADAELRAFLGVTALRYPALTVSAATGQGLGKIGPWLFSHLGVARVYTKAPGRPADQGRPPILRRGQTVEDVARLMHKDLARSLRYARVWGTTGFGGQQVGHEHPVEDGVRGRAAFVNRYLAVQGMPRSRGSSPPAAGGDRWELVRSAETSTPWRSKLWPPGRGMCLTVSSARSTRWRLFASTVVAGSSATASKPRGIFIAARAARE